MEKLKKYFGGYDLSWIKVIVFAVITAVVTAAVLLIPFLDNTSAQDIGVYPECWLLFALFIITNSKKWWEASLKTFVFFLISQPLIYLLQVPFSDQGWQLFTYYRYWFIITLLTLPGAAVAFLVKKKNALSCIVFVVALILLGCRASDSFITVYYSVFPYHLISGLFCVALALFLIFILFDKKIQHIVLSAVLVAVIAVFCVYSIRSSPAVVYLDEGEWTYTLDDERFVRITENGEDSFKISAHKNGSTGIIFTNSDGNTREFFVTSSNGTVFLTEMN